MHPTAGPQCSVCSEILPYAAGKIEPGAKCHPCEAVHPVFERAVAFGSYEGILRDLVHLLKYDQVRPAAGVLGQTLAAAIAALEPTLPAGVLAVVPVPLFRRKRAQRGFNQAEMIAAAALKELARPDRFELCGGTLVRTRETASQIGLTAGQRRENLRGAFEVRDAASIEGREVLLVDDVYTTGATASECSRVLRRAGASHVWVATAARTQKNFDLHALQAVQKAGVPEGFEPEEIEEEHGRVAAQC